MTFYVLPCESSSFTTLFLSVCFQDLLQQLEGLYTHTVLVVVVGLYTFESRIHKVAIEFPNIIEGLVAVQLCMLFVLQICLTDGTVNTIFSKQHCLYRAMVL